MFDNIPQIRELQESRRIEMALNILHDENKAIEESSEKERIEHDRARVD